MYYDSMTDINKYTIWKKINIISKVLKCTCTLLMI